MKKFMCLVMVGVLFLVAFGCSEKGDSNPKAKSNISESEKKGEISKKEPKTDPINDEQKKSLPDGSKPYTGIVKKVDGSNVIIDIEGIEYQFMVSNSTNLQKGNEPGKGKLTDLQPQMKINVLIMKNTALSIHYE